MCACFNASVAGATEEVVHGVSQLASQPMFIPEENSRHMVAALQGSECACGDTGMYIFLCAWLQPLVRCSRLISLGGACLDATQTQDGDEMVPSDPS